MTKSGGDMQFHPAVWIASWFAFALVTQAVNPGGLVFMAMPFPVLLAGGRWRYAMRLLKRVRWLLLAIAILFVFSTPGERMPGLAGALGASVDGLRLAAEHLLRLLLLLAALAVLFSAVGREGLLAGMHSLLAPLGARRERLTVRLALALELVDDAEPARNWREWLEPGDQCSTPRTLKLNLAPPRTADRALLAALFVATSLFVIL